MEKLKEYVTYDADLSAYLMLCGLKLIECKLETPQSSTKPRVLMRFFDEKEVARDLERVFMSSEAKKFSDLRKYLLRDIHRKLQGL